MKKIKMLVLLAIIALVTVTITMLAYSYWKIISVTEYDVRLNVGDRIGVDIDKERISFGTMLQNSVASRKIEATNNEDRLIKISIEQTGSTLQFVSPEENNIILNPNETRELNFLAKVPKDAAFGNYTGKVKITVTRA